MDDRPSPRRRQNTTSESSGLTCPPTPRLAQDLEDNMRLLTLLRANRQSQSQDYDQYQDTPVEVWNARLQGQLSVDRYVSTRSSNASKNMAVQAGDIPTGPYQKIGVGSCGAVFNVPGKTSILKVARIKDDTALWNDFGMHLRLQEHFSKHHVHEVRIPRCSFYSSNDRAIYDQNPGLAEAAQGLCHFPASVLIAERILPLPEPTRISLIEKYCSPHTKAAVYSDPANRDCLVKIYLGSCQGKAESMFFSLRNFKMYLNHMLELELDVGYFARGMATAMAVMHWSAQIDAEDVEFVLGSSAKKIDVSSADVLQHKKSFTICPDDQSCVNDFYHRKTDLWILDFDKVRRITMDKAGVAQAVKSAIHNEPYIPRPCQTSDGAKSVWKEFEATYLKVSERILGNEKDSVRVLPQLFITGMIDAVQKRYGKYNKRK